MDLPVSFLENSLQRSIIAVGGGKGGVGKSLISSSLAISYARLGYSTTLVDLDLGGANLHTCLGLPIPQYGLTDFLKRRVNDFHLVQAQTPLPKLNFICGFHDALNIADIDASSVRKIIQGIRNLTADVIILDLGAGTSDKTLDFFLMANHKIVGVIPEPTSIENGYRFLKSAFYRKLKSLDSSPSLSGLIDQAMDQRNELGIRSPSDLLKHIQKSDNIMGRTFVEQMREFKPSILVNQVRTYEDRDLGNSITSVCRQYFGVDVEYLGYLEHDNAAWQALRKKRPLVIDCPHSTVATQILAIAKKLIDTQHFKAVV